MIFHIHLREVRRLQWQHNVTKYIIFQITLTGYRNTLCWLFMSSDIFPCYDDKFEKILVKGTVLMTKPILLMYLLIHLASTVVVTNMVARKITIAINTIHICRSLFWFFKQGHSSLYFFLNVWTANLMHFLVVYCPSILYFWL